MGNRKTKSITNTNTQDDSPEPKYSFDEIYKSVIYLLLNGTKEQQDKVWKQLNEGKGDWVWMKMKVITDAYSAANAKGKEEFSLMTMERHLESGNAVLLKETFTDPETNIKYRLYRFKNGQLHRIPYATENMDKYVYDKALNKKFLGDFIELTSVEDTTYIPLDTEEKVKDYNSGGGYYLNHPLYKGVKPIVVKHSKQNDK